MPLPLAAAGVAAGGQLFGNYLSNKSNQKQNEQSQKFSLDMYKRQRRDNLTDWDRQNAYNDPSAQMKRYQSAGLNPNLIYGSSSGGGNASPVKSADIQSPQFRSTDFSASGASGMTALSAYYDTQVKQAQVDNLKTQNTVNLETAQLKKAQTLNTLTTKDRGQFDLGLEKQLRSISADARAEQLRKLKAESSITHTKSSQAILDLAHDKKFNPIKRNTQRLSNKLKQYEIELNKAGIQKNDPMYMRLMGLILGESHKKGLLKLN